MNDFILCLLVEWELQVVVLIVWLYVDIDWVECLVFVEMMYIVLVVVVMCFELLVIVVLDVVVCSYVEGLICVVGVDLVCVCFVELLYDDIWLCDFGLIILCDGVNGFQFIDFCFIGWGGKFGVEQDDVLIVGFVQVGVFGCVVYKCVDWVLEGGGVELDGVGIVFIIWCCFIQCYLEQLCDEMSVILCDSLYVLCILWLDFGYFEGDDIDVYIDIFVCFVLGDCIVFQVCDDVSDFYFEEFKCMVDELVVLCIMDGKLYMFYLLLWVKLIVDEGCCLVVLYVNYLIVNGVVLVLVYGDVVDDVVVCIIGEVYFDCEVVQVLCCLLIWQNGSLYCIIMQLLVGLVG